MRLLIIAMYNSVHTARWLSQFSDKGWEVHLFPSIDTEIIHPEITNGIIHSLIYGGPKTNGTNIKFKGLPVFNQYLAAILKKLIKKIFPFYKIWYLKRVIRKIKPDIMHSLEIQHAGYLVLDAKERSDGFPTWVVTNWGSDIYLFGRLAGHKEKVRKVLSSCNYYSCECQRDAVLAREYGFKGKLLPIFPNGGGFELANLARLRQKGPVSERRIILLKGYQHWSGRALFGLRALERSADLLKGYKVVIYSASDEMKLATELFQEKTGIPTIIIPDDSPHEEILKWQGKARVYLGLSISDAISTSLLEAMVMGAFPIQSWTSCADEWVKDGEAALLVPPEDPEIIEAAIRRALTDDGLVNKASVKNLQLAREKLDHLFLKEKTVNFYQQVFEETKK